MREVMQRRLGWRRLRASWERSSRESALSPLVKRYNFLPHDRLTKHCSPPQVSDIVGVKFVAFCVFDSLLRTGTGKHADE